MLEEESRDVRLFLVVLLDLVKLRYENTSYIHRQFFRFLLAPIVTSAKQVVGKWEKLCTATY